MRERIRSLTGNRNASKALDYRSSVPDEMQVAKARQEFDKQTEQMNIATVGGQLMNSACGCSIYRQN